MQDHTNLLQFLFWVKAAVQFKWSYIIFYWALTYEDDVATCCDKTDIHRRQNF